MKTKKTQVSVKGELRKKDLMSALRGVLDVTVAVFLYAVIEYFTTADLTGSLLEGEFFAILIPVSLPVLAKLARKFASRTEYVD